MSVVRHKRVRGWALVAALAALAVLVPQVPGWLPASAKAVDPGTLRDRILDSADRPYQGYAELSGSLTLPELPQVADVTSLLTTTTHVRTWYAGPERWRFDVINAVGERDVYRTPDGQFIWDYGANLLTRMLGQPTVRLPRAGDLLPPELARRVLSAARGDPVSALPARRVAGHDVAGLRLTPADPDTTIDHVDLWANPDTGLPVAVEVTARGGARPFLVCRFLELETTTPPAEVLTPKLPFGSGFSRTTAPDIGDALGAFDRGRIPPLRLAGRELRETDLGNVQGVGVYGTGLSAFVALPIPADVGSDAADALSKAGATSTALPSGAALELAISPLSVVVARAESYRWYLIAGLTAPEVLRDAADELTALRMGDQ